MIKYLEAHKKLGYALLFQHRIVRSNNDVAMCGLLCAQYLIGTRGQQSSHRGWDRGVCVIMCVVAVSTGPTANFFAT